MALLLLLLLPSACGPQDPVVQPAGPAAGTAENPVLLRHDFGTIPHGKTAEHDFVIDTRAVATDLVALGVHADCSCAWTKMLLRDSNGSEREITGQGLAEFAARADEKLVIRLLINTVQKEAVDLLPVTSNATLVLQHCQDPEPVQHRYYLQLQFRYGIDSPVRLRPWAHLDFEDVAVSTGKQLLLELSSDLAATAVHFGPAQCDDPRLTLELVADAEASTLRATFTPDAAAQPGPFRAVVTVATDLPDGYAVHIPASGRIVPVLQASPLDKISLGMFDFGRDHPENFVIVTDHDRRRPPEFCVQKLVDASGNDASQLFAVRLEPIVGDPRSTRVFVRWLGPGTPPGFRGELVLAKAAQRGPFLPIELVAFHRSQP
ncbi:MAG TPA: hypothetical protein VK348_11255 [Planctomycetota bacterium]|nr:hypothetical protein [Planctomycetota bacterium]